MLRILDIENYQSLAAATLELGQFTVVTGPTGSGKSAVIRALKLAAFNQRGTAFIRHGQKSCEVMLTDSGGFGVALARGSRDAYVLAPPGEQQKVFTKLGGQVPAEVAELLNFSELNFAAQFDRPYLLDSSGGQIARILSRLTNVDLVLEAARKGHVRKQEIARQLKARQAEVESLAAEAELFAGLPAQIAALDWAEKHADRAVRARDRATRLSGLLQAAAESAEKVREAQAAADALEPPSLAPLDALEARRTRLRELVTAALDAGQDQEAACGLISSAQEQASLAHDAIHDALTEAGACPTCGLPVPRKETA